MNTKYIKPITKKELLQRIRSVKMTLIVHPDNQENSEFADRISDLQNLEYHLDKMRVIIESPLLEDKPNLYYSPEED